jgi:hypothetical protein
MTNEAKYDPAAVRHTPPPTLLERIPDMTINELLTLIEENQLEADSPEYTLVDQRFSRGSNCWLI